MKTSNFNMFRTISLAILLMLGTVAAIAQTASGTIVDAANGE